MDRIIASQGGDVTKTQRRDALTFNTGRLLQLLEALLPNDAVVG